MSMVCSVLPSPAILAPSQSGASSVIPTTTVTGHTSYATGTQGLGSFTIPNSLAPSVAAPARMISASTTGQLIRTSSATSWPTVGLATTAGQVNADPSSKFTSAAFSHTAPLPSLLLASRGACSPSVMKKAASKPNFRECKAGQIYDVIDNRRRGSISKLDLLKAVQGNIEVANFVLPHVDSKQLLQNEQSFDAVHSVFRTIGDGRKYINRQEFLSFFLKVGEKLGAEGAQVQHSRPADCSRRVREAFELMDTDGDGIVSKLEFVSAVKCLPEVASLVVPTIDHSSAKDVASIFDAVDQAFDTISNGKKRIDCTDLLRHLSMTSCADASKTPNLLRAHSGLRRSQQRVLIIGPGFGKQLNPRQYQTIEQAGFQVEWVHVPNPESPGFPLAQHVGAVKAAIDKFKPDILASASKGGLYVIALWNAGIWKGPTLMLNAYPNLKELPKNVPVVIAHGLSDELYTRPRADLEQLISTGSPNMCLLYTTVDSGTVGGVSVRRADTHNMQSLLTFNCLPRLIDAALSPVPEMSLMCSWRAQLGPERIEAEEWLGLKPEDLQRFWTSNHQHGLDQTLFEVPVGCEEFKKVAAMFLAPPAEPPFYNPMSAAAWQTTSIVRIERVENGFQMDGSAKPYFETLQTSIEDQGLALEPGVHTRWAFHSSSAVDSIISDPMVGFQPLRCGTCLGSVWGCGTYFARDAIVMDTKSRGSAPDGTRKTLMCLLMTGMSCAGSPDQNGILPFRQKPHRYHSTVDSLSSPEIFIMQHPSSAYPAYVITFR